MTNSEIAVWATCRRGHRWLTAYCDVEECVVENDPRVQPVFKVVRRVRQRACGICGGWYVDLDLKK